MTVELVPWDVTVFRFVLFEMGSEEFVKETVDLLLFSVRIRSDAAVTDESHVGVR